MQSLEINKQIDDAWNLVFQWRNLQFILKECVNSPRVVFLITRQHSFLVWRFAIYKIWNQTICNATDFYNGRLNVNQK